MFTLIFSEQFDKSFSKINNKQIQKQIWSKITELESRAPIGKKLKGNPFWSIRAGKYRIIYLLEGSEVIIADILLRKQDYKDI